MNQSVGHPSVCFYVALTCLSQARFEKGGGLAWDQQPHPQKIPTAKKKPFRHTTVEKRRHILGCIHDGARWKPTGSPTPDDPNLQHQRQHQSRHLERPNTLPVWSYGPGAVDDKRSPRHTRCQRDEVDGPGESYVWGSNCSLLWETRPPYPWGRPHSLLRRNTSVDWMEASERAHHHSTALH